MYELYYSPGASSLAVHALLNAIEVPFTLHKTVIEERQNRSPEFLKLNPRGQVPALIADGQVLTESAAILIYLIDKHQSPLLPTELWKRALALQWLLFCNSNLHQSYSAYFMMRRFLKDEPAKPAACELALKRIQNLWHEVERQLGTSAWLAGDQVSAADLLLAVIANWSSELNPGITLGPRSRDLCARVIALPYFAKALKTEGVTYRLPDAPA